MVLSQDLGAQHGVQCVLYALDAEKSRSVISLTHTLLWDFPSRRPVSVLYSTLRGRERDVGSKRGGWVRCFVRCLDGMSRR